MGLRDEVTKRGGGNAGTSATTRDKEIARNPHPPEGLGRDGPISLLLLDLGSVALPTNIIEFMKVSTEYSPEVIP